MKSEKWKHIRQYENYSGNDFTNYELETNRKVRNLILYSSYSCGIKIVGTIFLSLQQNLCKVPSTVIMTDIKSSL
jgi:hypothetical protein